MSHEIEARRAIIDPRKFDVADAIAKILPRGQVIHGYSNASGVRMLMVLESRRYSDDAPLLGFGMDGTAERALGRALYTYALREQEGLDYITETQYLASTDACTPAGGHPSRFDNIVWGGDFKLYQEADVVVAASSYGGLPYGHSPLQVAAADALSAIEALTDTYDYNTNRLHHLPAISLGPGPA